MAIYDVVIDYSRVVAAELYHNSVSLPNELCLRIYLDNGKDFVTSSIPGVRSEDKIKRMFHRIQAEIMARGIAHDLLVCKYMVCVAGSKRSAGPGWRHLLYAGAGGWRWQ